MDINDLRGFSTVLVLLSFLAVCYWAFSPKRKQKFTDAANIPFADEEKHQQAQQEQTAATDEVGRDNK